MAHAKHLQGGSTLIETLVALVIFTVTTVTATAMLLESLRSLNNAINQQYAARIASNLQAVMTGIPRKLLVIPPMTDSSNRGTCNLATRCPPADWLAIEYRRLQNQAERRLPAGRIELVEHTSGIAIQVSWAGHASNQRMTYALQHDAA